MATKKITFDPDAGVPYGANLTIYGGANFNANLHHIKNRIKEHHHKIKLTQIT